MQILPSLPGAFCLAASKKEPGDLERSPGSATGYQLRNSDMMLFGAWLAIDSA